MKPRITLKPTAKVLPAPETPMPSVDEIEDAPLSSVKEWWQRDSCGHMELTCCENCRHFSDPGLKGIREVMQVEPECRCSLVGHVASGWDYSCPGFRYGRALRMVARMPKDKFPVPRWAFAKKLADRSRQLLHEGRPFPGAPFDTRWEASSSLKRRVVDADSKFRPLAEILGTKLEGAVAIHPEMEFVDFDPAYEETGMPQMTIPLGVIRMMKEAEPPIMGAYMLHVDENLHEEVRKKCEKARKHAEEEMRRKPV